MASEDFVSSEKRARFRFKAEIYDTYKNDVNITFYVLTVKIYGLNIDEYEIQKRFSQFAEFDSRLKARFHHKRLPQLPSKTLTKSAKHDDEFIAKRKTALNRYLRGIGQRLYLQNSEAIWQFFAFIDKINPYLHRYRVLHLKSIQCNDYQLIDPQTEPKESSGFSLRSLFSAVSSPNKPTNELSFTSSKSNKKILREWRVIYGAFIAPDIYLSVSTIHADNTKNNWWDSFMSTASDAKALISTNNPITHDITHDTNNEEYEEDPIEQPPPPPPPLPTTQNDNNINNNNNNNNSSLGSLESIDFDASSDIIASNKPKDAPPAVTTAPVTIGTKAQLHGGLSAWEAEKLAFAENEFYLGKIEIFKWNEAQEEMDWNGEETKNEIMYTSHCRFPLVRNRPSCALFLGADDLLLVGTSHGKILCFKLDRFAWTLSHICYLPRVFGGYVTDMVGMACADIYYQPAALRIRKENPLPRGSDKTAGIGSSFIYAVSADCHLAVFDLRSGDCIGHVQTGITGNLSITYCCEKLFVSNRNNIIVFIRSSATGDPVPQTELIGHTTTVYCLHSDEYNKRLFSGSGDNSVAVWYYDKLQDAMLQVQQLKSVSKSSKFTCITTAKNIHCVVAGADNGFITIWHEYDVNCDELSDKMYDLRMLIQQQQQQQQQQQNRNKRMDLTDDVPPSWTQQQEILKQNDRKFDISKNNMQNGSISSKRSGTNMVWKCVYTWKAHKGRVNKVSYYEEYNMLMSTSDSGQIRLVYLCDPGRVPPMQMVQTKADVQWPECLKDKLNKTFNEIQEIQLNNYPNTQYQNLNLNVANHNNEEVKDEEPEVERESDHELEEEEVINDVWNNNAIDDTKEDIADTNTKEEEEEKDQDFVKQMSRYSNTSLNELL